MPLGIDVVEPPFLFALQELGHRGARRAAGDARGAHDQEPGRADAPEHGGGDGGRRLPGHLRGAEAGRARERDRRPREQTACTRWARTTWRRSTRSPASAAARTRTTSPTASSAPATRHSSTSSCRSSATARATTARSTWARPPRAQKDAYVKAREWMDGAIALIKPGVTTDKIARAFPKAQEIGFESEMAAFGLNFCHGIGLGLHERPIISRLNSFDDPMELEAGMMFAVETYCPATRRRVGRAHRGGGDRDAGRRPDHHAVPGERAADREPVLSTHRGRRRRHGMRRVSVADAPRVAGDVGLAAGGASSRSAPASSGHVQLLDGTSVAFRCQWYRSRLQPLEALAHRRIARTDPGASARELSSNELADIDMIRRDAGPAGRPRRSGRTSATSSRVHGAHPARRQLDPRAVVRRSRTISAENGRSSISAVARRRDAGAQPALGRPRSSSPTGSAWIATDFADSAASRCARRLVRGRHPSSAVPIETVVDGRSDMWVQSFVVPRAGCSRPMRPHELRPRARSHEHLATRTQAVALGIGTDRTSATRSSSPSYGSTAPPS